MNTENILSKSAKWLTPLLVVATPAIAESDAEEPSFLEEVIVTAQKRSQNIQEIPIAVTAMTSDFLSKANMETASDVIAGVPNLQVQFPFGETQPVFSVRGQTMADYNTNQASPISFYVNEGFIGATFLQGMTLFDLERVEVLRGPQGTLYGKNTTGGAINVITRAPSFEGTQGNLTLGVGDNGRQHAHGAVETELVEETLAVRGAFTYTETDGYHENVFPGADDLASIDNWAGRLTLAYTSEALDATLMYASGESNGLTSPVINEARTPDGAGGFIDFTGTDAREGINDRFKGAHNKADTYSTHFDHVLLTLKFDLGEDYELTSITSTLDADGLNKQNTDGSPARLIEDDWGTDMEQITQDFRLVSDFDGPFNFIAGLYYSTDETTIETFFEVAHDDVPIPGFTYHQNIDQQRDSFALYAHTTYDLTDQLGLTVGARYTKDKGDAVFLGETLAKDRITLLDVQLPFTKAEFDDTETTGKVGLDYQLTDDILLYASFSRGYRSSAFNGGALLGPSEAVAVEPEEVDAFEAGVKSQLAGGRIQLNAGGFYYDYTNQQLINFIVFSQNLVNAPEAEIYGLETELTAAVTDGLTVNATLGWLQTEYEELFLSNPLTANPTDTIDLSGNELISSPELNFSLAVNYVIADNSAGLFEINYDTVFIDDQWFSAYNDEANNSEIKGDAYWIHNAKLSWSSEDETFGAALWVKNILDDDSYNYALNAQTGFGFDFYTAVLPRRFGVEVSARF